MKLPTSNKTASFGRKPHIKKGYYPGKLLKVEPYTDTDGNLREAKFGRMLIFHFGVYAPDPETGAPVTPLTHAEEGNQPQDVVIPKFVYHEYKNKKSGEYQTAITPNSAITKILKALGWTFSEQDVDVDLLIGHWVELNIDDYEQKTLEADETYKASTIVGINPYAGPDPGEIRTPVLKETKKVDKQVKHKAVEQIAEKVPEAVLPGDAKLFEDIAAKKKALKDLRDGGALSDKAYNQAIEQLDTQAGQVKLK
jgi:hypothetical protein